MVRVGWGVVAGVAGRAAGSVASRFASLLANVLARPDMPTEPDLDMATRDIMAIIKGMIDAAGAYGETDQADLAARVQRAVVGYISHRS